MAFEAPGVQHGAVGAFHIAAHLDRHGPPVLLEHPAALHVGAGRRPGNCGATGPRAASACRTRQVAGAATTTRRFSARRIEDEAGVGQVAEADGAVEALVDEIDHPVGEVQRDVTSGCDSMNSGTTGATCLRPKPAGAVTRRWPLALTPPAETLASALCRSLKMRWQSSRKAEPSNVSVILRVVRTSSLTPSRSSSASMRRPMIAGDRLRRRRQPEAAT